MAWSWTAEGAQREKAELGSAYARERMEMLCLEGRAQDCGTSVLIPHSSIAALPDEDAALLELPARSPYDIEVLCSGDLGHADLRYHIRILRPDGMPFVNPVFTGALVQLGSAQQYRLSPAQYDVAAVVDESNRTIGSVPRSEVIAFNYRNLAQIQRRAGGAEVRLDDVVSVRNNRIVVPAKLDVRFAEEDGGTELVPILLEEDGRGGYAPVDAEAFGTAFRRQRRIAATYRGEDRTRYVCSPAIRQGLEQVRRIGRISGADAARFRQQPRELLSGEVFYFAHQEAHTEAGQEDGGAERMTDWLPEEGQFGDDSYSDRVTGLAEIRRGTYYGSGHRTDWLPAEGEGAIAEDCADAGAVSDAQEASHAAEESAPASAAAAHAARGEKDFGYAAEPPQAGEAPPAPRVLQALDIKANFDSVDYAPPKEQRAGVLDERAMRDGIRLMDHQREGVAWMFEAWSRGYKGVLLADDMGLGKTLQTLAFAGQLRKGMQGSAEKPILIVAPIALLRNWQNEYEKFLAADVFREILALHGASLCRYETGGSTPNGKKKLELRLAAGSIALTTYETLRDYQFSFAEVDWGLIVVDEAQKMKNPSTGVTLALKAMKYDYAVCLSGTPVENSWTDLWSIMDFAQPGLLGELKEFRDRYVTPLHGSDAAAIERLGSDLKKRLNPLFMRRMKHDHLDGLPKKTVLHRPGQMPAYQKERYLSVIDAGRRGDLHPLDMLARLRNISLHPDLASKSPAAFYEMDPDSVIRQSARLIEAFDILEDVRRRAEKALIFVLSRDMQLILRHLLCEKFGIAVAPPVNGDVDGAARQRIVDRFNASVGFGVLILSPEAAGVGFTITAANHVIHLSRTWNPAKEDQATDRVYRIGQERDVCVYLPMSCHSDLGAGGSFDEKLDELLAYKRCLSENVLFPTKDTSKDGIDIARKLTSTDTGKLRHCHWCIEDVDSVKGIVFERIISDLYREMQEYRVARTPDSHDKGADVVVIEEEGNSGLLIQCKHVAQPGKTPGNDAVQEIAAAIPYYEKQYGVSFTPVAITNAASFSEGAKTLAAANGVILVARCELDELLHKYPLVRKY